MGSLLSSPLYCTKEFITRVDRELNDNEWLFCAGVDRDGLNLGRQLVYKRSEMA